MGSTIISLTMYPSVNYIVKEKYFGTAFGILQSISNIGSSIGPLIIGDILDSGIDKPPKERINHFYTMHFYLLILSFIGTLFAIIMNILDYNNKHIMNKVI